MQRALAAALLLRPGQYVSAGELTRWLWADEPPANSRNALHLHVSRLRAALAADPAVADRFTSDRTSYRLRVEPAESDLAEFRRLRAEARRELAAGDPGVAAATLRRAVSVARGRPLDGTVLSAAGEAHRTALEEELLAATHDRIDLELAAGRAGEAIAELSTLVTEHPLRERFHEQLMTALWRAGRQADALAAYAQIRATLIDQLGVEPGPGLRAAQARVLAGDPGSRPTAVPPVPAEDQADVRGPSGPTPAELPRDIASFTGRTDEVQRLVDLLKEGAGGESVLVVAITGPGGVGKSALAVRAAHQARRRFPDGQLYLDLAGYTPGRAPLAPHQALLRLLRSLGHDERAVPADPIEATARFRSVLAGRRVLLVLDNARDAAQVRDLVPGDPAAAVLITSRHHLQALDGVVHMPLGRLTEGESVDLLAGLAGTERVAAQLDDARRIVYLCERLPLGVRIAGGRLAARPSWSLASFADRLDDQRGRLDELSVDDLAVRRAFHTEYDILAEDATDLAAPAFRAAGNLALPEICAHTIAAYLDCPPPVAAAALDRLVDAHLVESSQGDRFHVHDLLRLYARERAAVDDSPDVHRAGLQRLARWYTDRVHDADRLLHVDRHLACELAETAPGFADRDAALAWLETERPRITAVLAQVVAADEVDLAQDLFRRLTGYFDLRGYWHDWRRAASDLIDLGTRTDRPYARALGLLGLGMLAIHHEDARTSEETFGAALDICETIDAPALTAEALNGLGLTLRHTDRIPEAVACHRRQLDIRTRLHDTRGISVALVNLAGAQAQAGEYVEAAKNFRRCIGIKQQTGDQRGYGVALHGLGRMEQRRGDLAAAAVHMTEARDVYAQVGDIGRLGPLLADLAAVHRQNNDAEATARTLREILDLGPVVSDTMDLAAVHAELALLTVTSPDATPQ
jgi:DNA-binding SARP family transcriptional activator